MEIATRVRNEWNVEAPIEVGLEYRTRTGAQAYRIEWVFAINATHAVVQVSRLNGNYRGNLGTHRVNGTSVIGS